MENGDCLPEEEDEVARSTRNLNMHGVFLHVLGDALGSVAVIISGLFIKYTTFSWRFLADPVIR